MFEMKHVRRVLPVALMAVCALALSGCKSGTSSSSKSGKPVVTINGRAWSVELAMTAKQRYTGLSWRKGVPDGSGMLFIYPRPAVLAFCMRGCVDPIDIAFIDANRRIVRIHTMQPEPHMGGEKAYSSDSPAQFALETAGGALVAAGVKVGDMAVFSADIPEAAKAQDEP